MGHQSEGLNEESAQNMEAKWEPEGQGSGGIRKVELPPGSDSGDSWEGLWEVGGQTLTVAFTWGGSYL